MFKMKTHRLPRPPLNYILQPGTGLLLVAAQAFCFWFLRQVTHVGAGGEGGGQNPLQANGLLLICCTE